MPIRPKQARAALSRVDPARLRGGFAVGLRDGAILALAAAGLSAAEISRLRASAITMDAGRLLVAVNREDSKWFVTLATDLGARLLAWLTERRVWGSNERVFVTRHRPLSPMGVSHVLYRYQGRGRARR